MKRIKTVFNSRLAMLLGPVVLFLAIGAGLRLQYVEHTPFLERGHDVDGHIGYIQYFAEHWSLPPIHENRQTYHPPL